MRNQFAWAGALALAIGALSQVETKAAYTNTWGAVIDKGTIIVTTRAAYDGHFFMMSSSSSLCDMDDNKGPGVTPGDAAMVELLQDNGYSPKLIPDKALHIYMWQVTSNNPCLDVKGNQENPTLYYDGSVGPAGGTAAWDYTLSAMLVVVSGSGSSADCIPPNTYGVPIVIGEHSDLGSSDTGIPDGHGMHFLYNHKDSSGNDTRTTGAYQYMKVMAPSHPIFQGIPLVSLPAIGANPADPTLAYIKIIRDPYPNEDAHVNAAGNKNYMPSTTWVDISSGHGVPAPGLIVLGVMADNTNKVIFACMDQGGTLGDTTKDPVSPWYNVTTSPTRLVQFFVCENGSNKSRRCFNALSVWGRILFVRCCQWAMWDPALQPYVGLGIIDVSQVSPSNIRLSWTGSSQYNYRIYGSSSITSPNWLPIADSIPNNGNGVKVSRTLNISAATQPAFLRVATLPEVAVDWVRP
jgi:hypothetical protein